MVLITGGSRGLGREMAFAAARCGADVVIASRKYETCVTTAEEIEAQTGRTAMPYGVHVGRWDQLDGLVEAVYDRFGKLDVLVNNAGMSPTYEKLTDVSEKLFDVVLNLNLKGPFRLSALVGERMVADGGGVDHQRQHAWLAAAAPLVPSVRRLQGRSERDDRGPGSRLRTDGTGQYPDAGSVPDRYQQGLGLGRARPCLRGRSANNPFSRHALQRAGQPDEIVGAALFLMSDASSFTTGSILRADGGLP